MNMQTFIKYYMPNSLNIKQIHNFMCVSVIIYTGLKKSATTKQRVCSVGKNVDATHIFALVNDKYTHIRPSE